MDNKTLIFTHNKRINSYQLAKLHTFEVTARHLSFSLAAKELSLTPSAISHRINLLEVELGFNLFERRPRKVLLTSEGERLYKIVKNFLFTLNQEIIDIRHQEISGTLTLFSRPSFAQCWLIPKIGLFHQQYPSIKLDILTGNDNIDFHQMDIDLAIYYDNAAPNGVHYDHLMDESIIPVCSPSYAENHRLFNAPEKLNTCTLLHDKQAWELQSGAEEWHFWANEKGIELKENIKTIGFDRSDLAILAAINHAGIAIGRKKLIQRRLNSGELITPFPTLASSSRHHYYIVTPSSNYSAKVNAFIQWIKLQVEQEYS